MRNAALIQDAIKGMKAAKSYHMEVTTDAAGTKSTIAADVDVRINCSASGFGDAALNTISAARGAATAIRLSATKRSVVLSRNRKTASKRNASTNDRLPASASYL